MHLAPASGGSWRPDKRRLKMYDCTRNTDTIVRNCCFYAEMEHIANVETTCEIADYLGGPKYKLTPCLLTNDVFMLKHRHSERRQLWKRGSIFQIHRQMSSGGSWRPDKRRAGVLGDPVNADSRFTIVQETQMHYCDNCAFMLKLYTLLCGNDL